MKNKISNFNSIKATIFDIEEILFKKHSEKIKFDVNEYAYLIYTSGTTSEPKGVIISHSMIEFTTKNIVKVLNYSNSDVDLLPLPLNHSFGLGCLHTSLYVGSTLVLLKNASNLEEMLDSLKKYKITTLAAIPATLTKILIFENKKMEDYFSEIRLIITNSTAIPKKTVIQFKEILKKGNLATYYGLTEASRSTFMIFDKNNHREESVGKCSPNVEIKIVNKEKNNLKLGWMPSHQSIYLRREVFNNRDLYRLDLGGSGDYEFVIRYFYCSDMKIKLLDEFIIKFSMGGTSTSNYKTIFKTQNVHRYCWKLNGITPPFYLIPLKLLRKVPQFAKALFK